jgi:hypothetical protein
MERILPFLMAPVGIVYGLAGPVTYILSVVDTWQTKMSVVWKLVFSLTLDAMNAAFWPITWVVWGLKHYNGYDTPLRLIFN